MGRPIPASYKIKNWPACYEAMKQRGPLNSRFDPDMVCMPPTSGKRGRPPLYGDPDMPDDESPLRHVPQVD
jgi:hypothetical protein